MSCKSTATIGKGEACIKSSSEENALHKTFVVAPIISPESIFYIFSKSHRPLPGTAEADFERHKVLV